MTLPRELKEILLCLTILMFVACSKTSKSSEADTATAEKKETVSTTSTGVLVAGTLAVGSTEIDTVLALPVGQGGSLSTFADAKSSEITSTGTLAIDLGASTKLNNSLLLRDWKLTADSANNGSNGQSNCETSKDSNSDCSEGNELEGALIMVLKDGTDRYAVGESMKYIAMPATADDSALNLPLGDLASESLDLGKISQGSDGLLTATTKADVTTFKLESATIESLAATDEPLRRARNLYMNTDPKSGLYVNNSPVFMFRGRLQAALSSQNPEVIWKDSGVTTWTTNYLGYILSFTSNDERLTQAAVCGASAKILKLKIPSGQAGIAHASDANTLYTELTNSGSTANGTDKCQSVSNAGLYFKVEDVLNNGTNVKMANFNWGGGDGFLGRIPTGYWDITLNDEPVARFDLAAAYPMNDTVSPARPIVYIPGLKLKINASTRAIENAQIKMFRWSDEDKAFREEPDLNAFKIAASNVTFTLEDYSHSGTSWNNQWDYGANVTLELPDSGTTIDIPATKFEKTWLVPQENAAGSEDDFASPSANSIRINYQMYGVGYMFDYRWAAP